MHNLESVLENEIYTNHEIVTSHSLQKTQKKQTKKQTKQNKTKKKQQQLLNSRLCRPGVPKV